MDSATFWIIPVGVLGAVIGSFLNVVVYRIPRGLSIGRPRWSFCPCCGHSIRPHHNVPVLSWLLLRGRCADCRASISVVYPAVECLTALVFISLWDALFIARVVPGVGCSVPASWPLALSYLVLFAALIACSAMDIDQYIVDIRICLLVVMVGVLLNGFAGLPREPGAEPDSRRSTEIGSAVLASPRPIVRDANRRSTVLLLPPSLCLAALVAGLAWAGTVGIAALLRRRRGTCEEQDAEAAPEEQDAGAVSSGAPAVIATDATGGAGGSASGSVATGDAGEAAAGSGGRIEDLQEDEGDGETDPTSRSRERHEPQRPARFQPLPIVLLFGLLVVLVVWLSVAPAWGAPSVLAGWQRGTLACITLMSALVLTSTVRREADEEVVEEIEAGRTGARAMALRELAWLAPAAIACVIVLSVARQLGAMDADWGSAVRWLGAAFNSGASSGSGVSSGWDAPSGWAACLGRIASCGWVVSFGLGAVHALSAAILAAAMGWTVRILGTLAFGKEAFGTGDIYIMAAIAAAGGFWLLFFAFFLAAILALVGVLATLFWKTHRAIPFGPWLSLGAMVALWLQGILVRFAEPAGSLLWSVLNGRGMAAVGG